MTFSILSTLNAVHNVAVEEGKTALPPPQKMKAIPRTTDGSCKRFWREQSGLSEVKLNLQDRMRSRRAKMRIYSNFLVCGRPLTVNGLIVVAASGKKISSRR